MSTLKLPVISTLEAIDEYCREASVFLNKNNLQNSEFTIQLLLREALTNAVIHGGVNNPENNIICSVTIKEDSIVIFVSDTGPGFDWRTRESRDVDGTETCGRGNMIMDLYSREYSYNEKGNQLTIIVNKKKTNVKGKEHFEEIKMSKKFDVKQEGSTVEITLYEDLVASFVRDFKVEIKAMMTVPLNTMIIDMQNVSMVDSIGIGFLVATHNSLIKEKGKLEVTNVSKDLMELFKSMRLHQHFKLTGEE